MSCISRLFFIVSKITLANSILEYQYVEVNSLKPILGFKLCKIITYWRKYRTQLM
ncbi:hypothetical protein PESP_a3098 [Pseudoalteromonas espejiana DSM 9414]|nr:hypothetical protein PESP_a3098 [Pseudoalteromonas espejiana DSM 9414]